MEELIIASNYFILLLKLLFMSFIIFGINAVFKPGYLLGRIGDKIRDFSQRRNTKYFPYGWVHKITIDCPPCMAYYWGVALTWLFGYNFTPYTIFHLIALSGLNYIINGLLYED